MIWNWYKNLDIKAKIQLKKKFTKNASAFITKKEIFSYYKNIITEYTKGTITSVKYFVKSPYLGYSAWVWNHENTQQQSKEFSNLIVAIDKEDINFLKTMVRDIKFFYKFSDLRIDYKIRLVALSLQHKFHLNLSKLEWIQLYPYLVKTKIKQGTFWTIYQTTRPLRWAYRKLLGRTK